MRGTKASLIAVSLLVIGAIIALDAPSTGTRASPDHLPGAPMQLTVDDAASPIA